MGIAITGSGAVSPAGWSSEALYEALRGSLEMPSVEFLDRPGGSEELRILPVPVPDQKIRHPRLRRVSSISHYAARAAMDAVGAERLEQIQNGNLRLGVIVNVSNGCVAHTRRFYEEALEDPATASPILFPETVFNSPASHLAAIFGTSEFNYTLLGDPTQFFSGLDLAAFWLESELVDGCVVVTTEEEDWITTEAIRLFEKDVVVSAGAGALYLEPANDASPIHLSQITQAFTYSQNCPPAKAQELMWEELPKKGENQLYVSAKPLPQIAPDKQLNLDATFGFSLVTPAWQAITAYHALSHGDYSEAIIPGIGTNQQAVGICLERRSA